MEERRIALVTGAGMGVGKGIAIELARAGYEVGVHYNSSSAGAEAVCNEIAEFGGKAVPLQADLSKHDGFMDLFNSFDKQFPHLDVYVNNSGITHGGRLLDMTEEQFDRVCSVNWRAAYFCVQQACQRMVDRDKGGSIIIVSSNQAKTTAGGSSAYGSMKAALNKFAQHVAMDFAHHNIRCNVIAPGFVDTGAARMEPWEGYKEETFEYIPMRRWVALSEIGQLAVFLSSPACASITGETLYMDGGVGIMGHNPPTRYGEVPAWAAKYHEKMKEKDNK